MSVSQYESEIDASLNNIRSYAIFHRISPKLVETFFEIGASAAMHLVGGSSIKEAARRLSQGEGVSRSSDDELRVAQDRR